MNCPYHALKDFLRGTWYRYQECWNSLFYSSFEDTRHLYSRRNLYPFPLWCRALPPQVKRCLYKASRSWLAGLNFHMMLTSQHCASDSTDWPWHIAAWHFYLALLFWSFSVGRECKIKVSACERYTINCGIPTITSQPRWSGKMHIIGKLFNWPRLLFFFVDGVGVFLEHVHRTLKASEWFSSFLFISLAFGLLYQAPQPLQHSLKICSDHRPADTELSYC